MNEPETIRGIIGNPPRTIAVVGLSENASKPSHYVSAYMQHQGYRIVPVNPLAEIVLGEKSYGSLADLPMKPDIVNVFRLPNVIPSLVQEMIAYGLTNLWVQQGIVNLEAAAKAEQAGMAVVMDRCIMVEHRRISLR